MTAERREAYESLLDEVGIDPKENYYSGQEDARAVLEGDPDYPLERFAALTYSGEYAYVTLRDSFDGAKSHATANCSDDLYAEAPGQIIDLDTGDRFDPDWDNLPWKKV